MPYRTIAIIVAALAVFLVLKPRYKILIALFVMTTCFDLVPRMVGNRDIWDAGAILLLITWGQLALLRPVASLPPALYVTALSLFIGWMGLSLVWSVLIYDYPLLDTLKAARHLVIGYLSFFVLARLYRTDPDSFAFLKQALYWLTFALLPVCVVQYLIGQPLLQGLVKDYGGVLRGLPVFLPIALLYLWVIASKALSGQSTALHEKIFAVLALVVTALTFTRGIYFAVFLGFVAMVGILLVDRKLSAGATALQLCVAVIGLGALFFAGALDRVIGRVASGIDILAGQSSHSEHDVDTFSGRLALAKERFELVAQHNPLVGYGFIHEDNVPANLRNSFKYGSIIQTPAYRERYALGYPYVLSLLSVDIGWVDIVVKTGIVGFGLFIFFLAAILFSYFRRMPADPQLYHFRLACYLQLGVSVLTMFNGNPLVGHVQLASFMLAGFLFCSERRPVARPLVVAITPRFV